MSAHAAGELQVAAVATSLKGPNPNFTLSILLSILLTFPRQALRLWNPEVWQHSM